MPKKNKTLIMIPTYNERKNIDFLLSKLKNLKSNLDILFIDDNSPDGTGEILGQIARQNKNINIIHREKN